jgi:ArsR family transcriptional regulator
LLCCIELFKALSDPTRLRIAALLAVKGELCVCELAAALDISEYNISRHLTKLKAAEVAVAERRSQWMYYSLSEPRNEIEKSLHHCLNTCFQSDSVVQTDIRRLSKSGCGIKSKTKKRKTK